MSEQRLNLGATPHLRIDHCGGDLELRGSSGSVTVIETDGGPFELTHTETEASLPAIDGSCAVRLPEGGQVTIGAIGGQLRLKNVAGSVEIERVGGDCVARRVGSLQIGQIGGDFHLKRSVGSISLGSIGGEAVLQDCGGAVRIELVGGDLLAQGVPFGLDVGQTGGDLQFRSEIEAEAAYRLIANGDVTIRLPGESSVRFVLSTEGGIRLDPSLRSSRDGEQVTATLGGGASTIEVSTHGNIRIRLEDNCETEDEFDVSFTEDFDNYMVDVSSQLDTHMRKLEERLEGLDEKIRRRVGRKLDAARRQVDAAGKQAHHAIQHASHAGHRPWGIAVPVHTASEPVREEERMAILKMLEDGKISVAEAQQLLAALEGGE